MPNNTYTYRLRFSWSDVGRTASGTAVRRRRAAIHAAETFNNPAPVRVLRAEFIHQGNKDIEWYVETDATAENLARTTINNLWNFFLTQGNVQANSLTIDPA